MTTKQSNAALWECEACGIWWCSQPSIEPTTFMIDLPIDLLEELGWENFRGWRLGGAPHVATCTECSTVNAAPLVGTAPVAPPLQLPLHDLLRPRLRPLPEPATAA